MATENRPMMGDSARQLIHDVCIYGAPAQFCPPHSGLLTQSSRGDPGPRPLPFIRQRPRKSFLEGDTCNLL